MEFILQTQKSSIVCFVVEKAQKSGSTYKCKDQYDFFSLLMLNPPIMTLSLADLFFKAVSVSWAIILMIFQAPLSLN